MFVSKTTIIQINPNDPYTEKKAMHGPCGYSLDLVSSYDSKQNKQ